MAGNDEKKKLEKEIKNAEESVHVMRIAMKGMNRFNSSFSLGLSGES